LFIKFVDELQDLHENGLVCFPNGQLAKSEHIHVHTILSSVVSVTRYILQNMHQYNGQFGCSFCLHPGEKISVGNGYARVYPGTIGIKRNA